MITNKIVKVGKKENKITVVCEGESIKLYAAPEDDCDGCYFSTRPCPRTTHETEWKGVCKEDPDCLCLCSAHERQDGQGIIWVPYSKKQRK